MIKLMIGWICLALSAGLVISSFLYLWYHTGALLPISISVLLIVMFLMGIYLVDHE